MRRSLIAGLTVIAIGLATPFVIAAAGRAKRTCSINVVFKHVGIAVLTGNPPQNGSESGASIAEGTVCGTPFHGAARDLDHFPRLGQVKATGTMFGPQGAMNFTFEEKATISRNNNVALHGKATITSGSGIYKGATGSASLSGSQPANADVTTQHIRGSITL